MPSPEIDLGPPNVALKLTPALRKIFKEILEESYHKTFPPLPIGKSEVHLDVPFVASSLGRCAVANTHSILKYFYPDKELTPQFVDKLCGYRKGYGTWPTKGLVWLREHARLDVAWIGGVDLRILAESPELYLWLEHNGNHEAYMQQLSASDLAAEKRHATIYLKRGLRFENRPGSREDIMSYLADGYLARASVSTGKLPNATVDLPHSLLVVGYTQDYVIVHNADHINGNVPDQHIPWEQFEAAWNDRDRRLIVIGPAFKYPGLL